MDATRWWTGTSRLTASLVVFLIGATLPVEATDTIAPEIPADDDVAPVRSGIVTRPCSTTDDEAEIAAGLAVFRAQYCGTCHTLDAAGSAGTFGPTQNGVCATAVQRVRDASFTGSASTAKDYILESIIDPLAYVVPGYERSRFQMPAYTNLSERELNALLVLLMRER